MQIYICMYRKNVWLRAGVDWDVNFYRDINDMTGHPFLVH